MASFSTSPTAFMNFEFFPMSLYKPWQWQNGVSIQHRSLMANLEIPSNYQDSFPLSCPLKNNSCYPKNITQLIRRFSMSQFVFVFFTILSVQSPASAAHLAKNPPWTHQTSSSVPPPWVDAWRPVKLLRLPKPVLFLVPSLVLKSKHDQQNSFFHSLLAFRQS